MEYVGEMVEVFPNITSDVLSSSSSSQNASVLCGRALPSNTYVFYEFYCPYSPFSFV